MKLPLILLFILLYTSGFSQKYFPLIKQIHISEYRKHEENLKSQLIQNRNNYVNPSTFRLAQPIRFKRVNTKFHPAPIVTYYFSIPDSIVREINIEFDSLNYLPQTYEAITGYEEPIIRLKEFNRQYELIQRELITVFGKPNKSDSLLLKEYGQNKKAWKRSDEWEKDSLSINMYLVFHDKVKGEFKIRAYIQFKDNNKNKEQTKLESNPRQDSVAKAYLQLIFNENYEESWKLIDESLKKQITYENYVKAVSPFNLYKAENGEKIISYMFGTAFYTMYGTVPYYSYKFDSDKTFPPKITFDITFPDEKSLKIISVRPKKLMR